MKKILAIIIILLFLILLWCTKGTYKECCNNNEIKSESIQVLKPVEPLVFSWNSSKPETNDKWLTKQNEILKLKKDGKILEISGPYFTKENEKIGLLRAQNISTLFNNKLDSTKIELNSHLINYYPNAKTTKFGHVKFNWLTRNENIQEINNKALIYFPTNSTKKIENININNYLDEIVENLKTNNKNVVLTGHSDNRGNKNANYNLALKRAESIKNLLINKGINANRIITSSKGEENPIANNNTKEGQQKNRRVELEIK